MASLNWAKRKAVWPAILSALVAPGVGQLVNRDFRKGIFLLVSSIGSFLWFSKVVTERLSMLLPGTPDQWATNQTVLREALMKLVNENSDMFMTFQILIIVIWVYAVVDAYIVGRKLALQTPSLSHENPDSHG